MGPSLPDRSTSMHERSHPLCQGQCDNQRHLTIEHRTFVCHLSCSQVILTEWQTTIVLGRNHPSHGHARMMVYFLQGTMLGARPSTYYHIPTDDYSDHPPASAAGPRVASHPDHPPWADPRLPPGALGYRARHLRARLVVSRRALCAPLRSVLRRPAAGLFRDGADPHLLLMGGHIPPPLAA